MGQIQRLVKEDSHTWLFYSLEDLARKKKLMLDASTKGNIKCKTLEKSYELIENMATNDNKVHSERGGSVRPRRGLLSLFALWICASPAKNSRRKCSSQEIIRKVRNRLETVRKGQVPILETYLECLDLTNTLPLMLLEPESWRRP